MNISLPKKTEISKTSRLQGGLDNDKKTKKNVFDHENGGDSSEEEEIKNTSRAQVNARLRQQQEAVRQSVASVSESNIYDYDGVYDTFHRPGEKDTKEKDNDSDANNRNSRYMNDLLRASAQRKQARDIVYERKMARESGVETGETMGKEKFVTAAYRRKLAERQEYLANEAARDERDKDVTSQKNGMLGFYEGLSKNVALGGGGKVDQIEQKATELQHPQVEETSRRERPGEDVRMNSPIKRTEIINSGVGDRLDGGRHSSRQQLRLEKIAAARERYLQRHNISPQDEQVLC